MAQHGVVAVRLPSDFSWLACGSFQLLQPIDTAPLILLIRQLADHP
jgi:hypothetical protein